MAREGLRRWPDSDWGWQFRLVCAEDLIVLSRVEQARALLDVPGFPAASHAGPAEDGPRQACADPATGAGEADARCSTGRASIAGALGLRDTFAHGRPRAQNFAEAWAYDRAALADAEHEHDPYLLAWTRLDTGNRLARASRFDESVSFLNESLESAGFGFPADGRGYRLCAGRSGVPGNRAPLRPGRASVRGTEAGSGGAGLQASAGSPEPAFTNWHCVTGPNV